MNGFHTPLWQRLAMLVMVPMQARRMLSGKGALI